MYDHPPGSDRRRAEALGDAPPGDAHPEREVWQIGALQLDVGRQRVLRGEEEIPLPKLSFDLLLTLARRAPDVVSYDELMDRVWTGLVVSPETVVQRVRLLRMAIGDVAESPTYIEALRSRGYRLVASARRIATPAAEAGAAAEAEAEAEEPSDVVAPHLPDPERGARPWPLLGLGALFGCAVLVAWAAIGSSSPWRAASVRAAESRINGSTSLDAERAARTVAVLPFDDLSPDRADAFISLAVPESTLDRLAALGSLTIIARDSAFAAGRAGGTAREMAQRLGAAWLIQGSTQRVGDRVRVTARLIDGRNETQAWAARFERPLIELPELQDEIANGIVDALGARLAGVQRRAYGKAQSKNVEANLAFLGARALLRRETIAEAAAAATLLERAVAIDPSFAAAQAALYEARMLGASLRRDDLAQARQRYAPLIVRAFEIDQQLGAAHLARARWSDAAPALREADFLRGIELEPSNAAGMVEYSSLLDRMGRKDEARRWLERALLIDPLSPRGLFRTAGRTLEESGKGVEQAMLAVLERDPNFYSALQRYGKYRWQGHGETAQAIEILERAIASDPENPWARHTVVPAYLDAGEPDAAREVADAVPVSAASTRTLRALYAGDVAAAARAALQPEAHRFALVESWGRIEALRDAALADPTQPAAERQLRELVARNEQREPGVPTLFSYRARILLAHLLIVRGERDAAERDLRALLDWIAANERFGLHHTPKALSYMLLGEPDRALAELRAAIEEDRDFRHWWYTFDRELIWAPLRTDPRFLALRDLARTHARRQHDRLESLRATGRVPRRG